MLFLHGAGERGRDNEAQLTHGAGLFLDKKNRRDFPAIVVFPQCAPDEFWTPITQEGKTGTSPSPPRPNPPCNG
ncbi:MAG: hypothetical protein H6573_35060 [Lewinellaceae bacterium]|nr:hypothetical protein [Lewinellaceae bacterium]